MYTIFYLAIKKNTIINFAEKCMKLENITLSEVIMAQKTKHHMFCFIVLPLFGFWLLNFISVYLPGIKGPGEGGKVGKLTEYT